MNDQSIFRLKQKIVGRISSQRRFQIDTRDFSLPVLATKNLRIRKERVGRQTTCQVHSIANVQITTGSMDARLANLARNCDLRRIFEVVSAEYANRVQRLKEQVRLWISLYGFV